MTLPYQPGDGPGDGREGKLYEAASPRL